jgi:hypothetical protein
MVYPEVIAIQSTHGVPDKPVVGLLGLLTIRGAGSPAGAAVAHAGVQAATFNESKKDIASLVLP